MRIFLAGATGVIGVRLVPLLVGAGHEVAGLTRSPSKADLLTSLGAEPVVADVFEADDLAAAVAGFGPDMVIHQLTDLPDDAAGLAEHAAANARMRREGTANLLAAARAVGTRRLLAQSVAWPLGGDAGLAVGEMEQMVLDFGGVVLRYGQFYGVGTYHPSVLPSPPRIQIDAAARRTVDAIDSDSGVVLIVDPASG